MSEISFYCTLCGQPIRGNESFYGSAFTCAFCNARVAIPQKPGDVAQPAAAADTAAPPPPATPPAVEQDIAQFVLSWKAYLGTLVLSAFLVLLAGGGAIAIQFLQQDWKQWLLLVPGLLLLVPVYLVLKTWLQKLSIGYKLTSQRLFVVNGLFSKRVNEIELFRIRDVTVDQTMLQRMVGCGTVSVLSTDETTPKIAIAGVSEPMRVKELIRDSYKSAREKVGLRATEFIQS